MRAAQLIGGLWLEAEDDTSIAVVNPATGDVVSRVPVASAQDLDIALDAAESAWDEWKSIGAWKRSEILRSAGEAMIRRVEEIARRLTEEMGKPIVEARLEVLSSVEQFDWFADEARRIYGRMPDARNTSLRYEVRREPVGPVAAFTPWNFPLLLAARKVAPALAAGCPIIVKPASEAPGPTLLMAECLIEAGMPAGVLQVVTGDAPMISERLISSPVIRKVSFTGSVPVGRVIMELAARNIANVSMELGGHAPVVVMGDVDPVEVGRLCAEGKFRNAGQICISPTRFIVQESIADEFVASFAERTRSLRVGDGLDETTDVGPLVHDKARSRLTALVDDAVNKGAVLEQGGGVLPDEGFYFEPTVLDDVPLHAEIMSEEPFGPVAPITRFSGREEAISIANSTSFGLASYVFTGNLADAATLSESIQAGIVGVNTFAVSAASVPFGGVKQSGIGVENGTEAMDSYLVSKTVVISPFAFE